MRVEFEEKYIDIPEDEKKMHETMNIPPKSKRLKWRRIWLIPETIFALKEVSDTESVLEFNDGSTIVVRGGYVETKEKIEQAEEPSEDDLEL